MRKEELLPLERLLELAQRAEKRGIRVFTPFLTPPERQLAEAAARKAGIVALSNGGFPEAERQMVCFTPDGEADAYPMQCVHIAWPAQAELSHRDVLGSLMGLGLERRRVGDIAVESGGAWVMAESAVAAMLREQLTTVGRYAVRIDLADAPPAPSEPDEGLELTGTLSSLRLDAVLGLGYRLSRGKAVELVASGAVRLRYEPCIRPDATVRPGDVISVRGRGRLTLVAIGNPTKKDRLPVTLRRLGDAK